jgi:hypothetical protein
MENYSKIIAVVETIESLPADSRSNAYRTLIDIMWQNIPPTNGAFSERSLFASGEFQDLEKLAPQETEF